MTHRMKVHPFNAVATQATASIAAGATIYQQWICSHCDAKQTMSTPNTLFRAGICEECGQTTPITKCNFMASFNLE